MRIGKLCEKCAHEGCCDDLPYCNGASFSEAAAEEGLCRDCIHFDGDGCETHLLPDENGDCDQYEEVV